MGEARCSLVEAGSQSAGVSGALDQEGATEEGCEEQVGEAFVLCVANDACHGMSLVLVGLGGALLGGGQVGVGQVYAVAAAARGAELLWCTESAESSVGYCY